MLKDRDNLALRTYPTGRLLGIAVYWIIVWSVAFLVLKTVLQAFGLSYGYVSVERYFPWLMLGVIVAIAFLACNIKFRIFKDKSVLIHIYLVITLLVSFCLCSYYLLSCPTPEHFRPYNLIARLTIFLLEPVIFKILVTMITVPLAVLGNIFLILDEFGTIEVRKINRVIGGWILGALVALPLFWLSFVLALGILALVGNLITLQEIKRSLTLTQQEGNQD